MSQADPNSYDKNVTISLNNFPTHDEVNSSIHSVINIEKLNNLYHNHLIKLRCAELISSEQYKGLTKMLKSVDEENGVVAKAAIDTLIKELEF